MDIRQRIAQFEKMAHDDPGNDMAHFSLGQAYHQAGRFAEAAASFRRCVEINPEMSKAYQLAGASLMAAGEPAQAGRVLTDGYLVAARRGDLMPRNAMGEMLMKLGLPVPAVEAVPGPGSGSAKGGVSGAGGGFVCRRTGRPGTKLDRAPFRGPVGEWIAANISAETWRAWIGQGTKVINELRLDLSREDDAETYDRHMREYLGIDDELLARLSGR